MAVRSPFPSYMTGNPLYRGATLTFFTVAAGVKTTTKATLFEDPTGTTEATNPQTLDSDGKLAAPVYVEVEVVASATALTVADHDTAVFTPGGSFRGDWATATDYIAGEFVRAGADADSTNDIYIIDQTHTSGVFATDITANKLTRLIDVSDFDAGDATIVALSALVTAAGQLIFATGVDTFAMAGGFFAKNSIINPNFDIWQRGTSFTSLASGEYSADRYFWSQVGVGVIDLLRSTSVPSNTSDFSLQVDVTTADTSIASGDVYTIGTRIEGYDAMQFGFGTADAKQLTLSFWVRSSLTGIHCVSFRNSGSARSFVVEYTINGADTWEYKTVTITADTTGTWLTDNGIGVGVGWALAAGTDFHAAADTWVAGNKIATSNQVNAMDNVANNFHISRVQLELGSVATPFERRSIGQELTLCQRYYCLPMVPTELTFAAFADTSRGAWITPFPVEMRAVPTLTKDSSGWTFNTADTDIFRSATRSAAIFILLSTGIITNASVTGISIGDLTADAEL